MPIIILFLVIVFFVPIVSWVLFSLLGILMLFYKALPYILAGFAVIGVSLFLLNKTIDFSLSSKFGRKKSIGEFTKELVDQNENIIFDIGVNWHNAISIGRYYLINEKFENCPTYKKLKKDDKEKMELVIEKIFTPALSEVKRKTKFPVDKKRR
ncbi:hypothetical protein [Bacillus sp. UMB0728]|uniref:hypothetical protein n=1 Tax=Bacillus sp. UMB0728 TaxID=2066052 RepID=UPI000C77B4F8|nr:hypothetical protein [Bacillus sp. UMB0728]PLR71048.1 hypothetical protein CYJ37_19880 [Bacillus sp. UMB0728]